MRDTDNESIATYPLFIAMQKLGKGTGKLVVKGEGQDAEILIVSGVIVVVKSWATEASSLTNLLLNTGIISEAIIRELKKSREMQGAPLLNTLVSMGYVSETVVREAKEYLCYEAVVDLVLQKNLSVTIEEIRTAPAEEMCSIPIRFLLRDAQTRLDEWPQIARVVPHDRLVFAKTQTFVGTSGIRQWTEIPLEYYDRQVLVYVNGRRSVREISRLTGQSIFRVSKALANLLELGLVRLVEKPLPETRDKKRRTKYFVAFAIIIALLSAVTQPIVRSSVPIEKDMVVAEEQFASLLNRDTTTLCADVYWGLTGSMPEGVSDIKNIGVLKRCKVLGQ